MFVLGIVRLRVPLKVVPMVVPLVVLLFAGCGASPATGGVTRVAADFQRDVAAGDLAPACALLSAEVRSSFDGGCPAALKQAKVPGVTGAPTTSVYGKNGLVRWRGEAVFVSRFPEGWRVVAAGCTAQHDKPYQCSVSGG